MPERKRPAGNNGRYIPAELVEKILLNLPFKSVLRFSSVSKSWNSIIFGSEFVKRYRGREMIVFEPSSTGLVGKALICPLSSIFTDNPIKYVTPLVGPFEEEAYIHAMCDELWCVQVKNSLFLWNPSLRTYRKLPGPLLSRRRFNNYVYGLGYDSVGDDYKILKICKNGEAELYSLRYDSWRKIQPFPKKQILSVFSSFVSGSLHWMVRSESWRVMISFDLSTEKYGEMALPEEMAMPAYYHLYHLADGSGSNCEPNVTVSRGMLCLWHCRWPNRFVMWVMRDYGIAESWTKELDIPLFEVFSNRLRPFYFYDTAQNQMKSFISAIDDQVILSCEGNSTYLMVVKYIGQTIFNSFIYVESLVLANLEV